MFRCDVGDYVDLFMLFLVAYLVFCIGCLFGLFDFDCLVYCGLVYLLFLLGICFVVLGCFIWFMLWFVYWRCYFTVLFVGWVVWLLTCVFLFLLVCLFVLLVFCVLYIELCCFVFLFCVFYYVFTWCWFVVVIVCCLVDFGYGLLVLFNSVVFIWVIDIVYIVIIWYDLFERVCCELIVGVICVIVILLVLACVFACVV